MSMGTSLDCIMPVFIPSWDLCIGKGETASAECHKHSIRAPCIMVLHDGYEVNKHW